MRRALISLALMTACATAPRTTATSGTPADPGAEAPRQSESAWDDTGSYEGPAGDASCSDAAPWLSTAGEHNFHYGRGCVVLRGPSENGFMEHETRERSRLLWRKVLLP
jgi:hypothetical protein